MKNQTPMPGQPTNRSTTAGSRYYKPSINLGETAKSILFMQAQTRREQHSEEETSRALTQSMTGSRNTSHHARGTFSQTHRGGRPPRKPQGINPAHQEDQPKHSLDSQREEQGLRGSKTISPRPGGFPGGRTVESQTCEKSKNHTTYSTCILFHLSRNCSLFYART